MTLAFYVLHSEANRQYKDLLLKQCTTLRKRSVYAYKIKQQLAVVYSVC
jgi:hypothetical protein